MGAVAPDDAAARQDELDRVLPLTEALVHRLFGAGGFELFRAVRAPGLPLQVVSLHGAHPDLRFTAVPPDPDWVADLAPTDVVAVAGDRSIPVYPMVVPTQDDQAEPLFGLEDPAAMLDQVSRAKLVLMGVRKAAYLPRQHQHLVAALGALAAKNVNVSVKRPEVKSWTIDAWSRHTASVTLEELTGRKYFPLFYLEREGVDGAMTRLQHVAGGALLLLGDAGSGKSSLIARMAQQLLGVGPIEDVADWVASRHEPADIVAWLSGRADYAAPTDAQPGTLLIEALGRKLGIAPGAFQSAADLLTHLESQRPADMRPDRRIWLLLDGVNEAERFVDLLTEIDALLPHLAALPRVRLVVAMRSGAFNALAARAATLVQAGTPVFANLHCFPPFPVERGGEERWLSVRPFSPKEEGAGRPMHGAKPRCLAGPQRFPGANSTPSRRRYCCGRCICTCSTRSGPDARTCRAA